MVFSVALLNGRKKFKFLYTTGSWQDSTKVFLDPLDFTSFNKIIMKANKIGVIKNDYKNKRHYPKFFFERKSFAEWLS